MTTSAAHPKTVAVVTRNTNARERFEVALRAAGHRVVGLDSERALAARLRLTSSSVDLVVIDLTLERQGVEGVRRLRGQDAQIPILIFSGSVASAQDIRDLDGLGVSGYINEHSAVHHIVPALAPQLFPDSFNRRTSLRVTLDISVAYRVGDAFATAPSLNLSKGGLGIRTMTPPERGTRVTATFRLPGSQHEIEAAARVAWSDQRAGMGLQFVTMDPVDQSAIDEFVDGHVAIAPA